MGSCRRTWRCLPAGAVRHRRQRPAARNRPRRALRPSRGTVAHTSARSHHWPSCPAPTDRRMPSQSTSGLVSAATSARECSESENEERAEERRSKVRTWIGARSGYATRKPHPPRCTKQVPCVTQAPVRSRTHPHCTSGALAYTLYRGHLSAPVLA